MLEEALCLLCLALRLARPWLLCAWRFVSVGCLLAIFLGASTCSPSSLASSFRFRPDDGQRFSSHSIMGWQCKNLEEASSRSNLYVHSTPGLQSTRASAPPRGFDGLCKATCNVLDFSHFLWKLASSLFRRQTHQFQSRQWRNHAE